MISGSTLVYPDYTAGVVIQLQRYVDSCACWVNVPTYIWQHVSDTEYAHIFEDDVSVNAGVYRFSLIHTAYEDSGLEVENFGAYSDEIRVR